METILESIFTGENIMLYELNTRETAQKLEDRISKLTFRLNIEETKSGDRNPYSKDYANYLLIVIS